MPKSRLRGGAKAHRKRIERRKKIISDAQTQMQKMWQQEMLKKIEEMNKNKEEEVQLVTQEIENSGIEIPLEIKL
jgi:hypothetical protein